MIRKDDLHDLGQLFKQFARPYWPPFLLAALVSLAVAFLTGIQPLVLAPVIDSTLLSTQSPAGSWREMNLNIDDATLLDFALSFVLSSPAVSVVIPGASSVAQVQRYVASSEMPAIGPERLSMIRQIVAEEMGSLTQAFQN